ncbi:MAG: hypothetical protein LBK28_00160, partial [Propionibacteriaceae bacterium]|nr:hypothetical protein [Propionibacteriaceae bacterium]
MLVAALAMLALFSGCYGNNPNVAVTIGDRTITEAELSVYTDAINVVLKEAGASNQFAREDMIGRGIIGVLALQGAASQPALGKLVGDAQLAEFSQQPDFISLAQQTAFQPFFKEFLAALIVINAVNSNGDTEVLFALQTVALEIPVKLNPRYGDW